MYQSSGIWWPQLPAYSRGMVGAASLTGLSHQGQRGYSNELTYAPEHAEMCFDTSLDAAECPRDRGYEIADPPSRQAFVEALVNDEPPPWYPHHEAMAAGGLLSELEAECPQPADIMAAG